MNGNPVVQYDSLLEASRVLGFEAKGPAVLNGSLEEIIVIGKKALNLRYKDGSVFRKAKGSGDISGVSEPYPEVRESVLDGRRITEKGRDGRVFLVLWTDGTFSYSFHTPLGANSEAVRLLIESVTAAD